MDIASETVCVNLCGPDCILDTNCTENVIEMQNTFHKPVKYKLYIMCYKYCGTAGPLGSVPGTWTH